MGAFGSKRVARIKARTEVRASQKAAERTKVVAYFRVSTDEQANSGTGLETQQRAVHAFAESQGYEVVEAITDPGFSGATRPADRPGFARVMELAEARAFSILLVYKIDRLARDIRYAITTVSDLAEQHEVAFRSVTESVIDTSSPMGRTFFAIFAGMAENERYTIRDRTAGGRMNKAGRGGFAGGRAPYGYRVEGGDKGQRQLVVVPEQAKVVKRIYKAVKREKRTLRSICAELNGEGIPAPNGGIWHPSGISYIVDNQKYRGALEYLFQWNGATTHVLQDGTHAPIL
ncbi:recombinase family protein [Methylobacterium sp. CCH5-D2]|uniref:recombinase family protein n=1 Tax=Methylobacterium sp. CCH5-D2 TaxID=1768765 RepID=UPI00083799FA|nr:recombinase family protein [Methylobacterium sp. CCH5-D2]